MYYNFWEWIYSSDFVKIANAYGIKAAKLDSYLEIDNYRECLTDNEPCLLNIMLTPGTSLIPKVKWETCTIKPDLDAELLDKVNRLLQK